MDNLGGDWVENFYVCDFCEGGALFVYFVRSLGLGALRIILNWSSIPEKFIIYYVHLDESLSLGVSVVYYVLTDFPFVHFATGVGRIYFTNFFCGLFSS